MGLTRPIFALQKEEKFEYCFFLAGKFIYDQRWRNLGGLDKSSVYAILASSAALEVVETTEKWLRLSIIFL